MSIETVTSRRRFLQTTAAAGAVAAIGRPAYAQQAEFAFKWANNIPATHPSTNARANARAGKIAMTFHLSEDFKRSLRLVQARRGHGCTLEQLAAEALNDLFSKYNVPTVASDG